MIRIATSAVGIPVLLAILWYGGSLGFFLLVALAAVIANIEFHQMISHSGVGGFVVEGTLLAFLMVLNFYFGGVYFMEWIFISILTLFLAWFIREDNEKIALDQISFTLMGAMYTGGLLGFFLLIRQQPEGAQLIIFLLLIIWSGDALAYYVGRNFGRRPLAKTSPNKTWEGAVGGLCGSMIAALISGFTYLSQLSPSHCLLVAFICGIIGQFGDLAESLLKRNTGVKDSGNILPGHGGILDRIDSLLFAGPAFYLYLKLAS
ncbi:MAG: phosphatidate cytidylyltransferase [Candidatus Nitrohelix vancouverensis]|uniref:Phosphatidate cytidylyltransferase n=1 Tax=Candidatus Nitrohelix vancouverensis TaxID=2705534 RepID=A0A7T0C0U4_9BACT|nr:MAG: phosphatidate cytidylyltransferase [Candidatus Nitrohelix vancouverensis]